MDQSGQKEQKVYITGSDSFEEIPEELKKTINKILMKGFTVFVGNESKFDHVVQDYLRQKEYRKVCLVEVGLPKSPAALLHPDHDEKWGRHYVADKENIDAHRQSIQTLIKDCTSALVIWDGSHDIVESAIRAMEDLKIPKRLLRKKGAVQTGDAYPPIFEPVEKKAAAPVFSAKPEALGQSEIVFAGDILQMMKDKNRERESER